MKSALGESASSKVDSLLGAGGGYAGSFKELLGENLRAFETGGSLGGADDA